MLTFLDCFLFRTFTLMLVIQITAAILLARLLEWTLIAAIKTYAQKKSIEELNDISDVE